MFKSAGSILISIIAVSCLAADNWARWRGPDGDGIYKGKWNPEALSRGEIMWRKSLGPGYSSVAVDDGKVYTMGWKDGKDHLYCFNAKSGKELWRHSQPGDKGGGYAGPRATPVIDNGMVYTLSVDGLANCVDAESGKLKWSVNLGKKFNTKNLHWKYSGSPLVYKDMVVFSAGDHGVALDKNSGAEIWASGGKGNYSTPILFKNRGKDAIAIFGEEELFALNPVNGEKLWTINWKTKYNVNAADPVFHDDKVFISSGYGKGCALFDISTGNPRELWRNTNMKNHFGTSVLIDGNLYGIDGQAGRGNLAAIKWKNGELNWESDSGFGAMVGAGKYIVGVNDNGVIYAAEASPRKFTKIAEFQSPLKKNCWNMPVICDGQLYCRDSRGTIVCVNVSK